MAKRLTKSQTLISVIGAIIFAICACIIGWYSYIALHAEEKMTATDISIGKQFTTGDNTSADIIEIVYHSNSAKNGLECFDIKFNYLTDDTHDNIYWQGLQYVGKNEKSPNLVWFDINKMQEFYNYYGDGEHSGTSGSTALYDSFIDDANEVGAICGGQTIASTGWWFWKTEYKSYYFSPFVKIGQKYNYQSLYGDDTLGSTNPLGLDSRFTIQVGDESFYMTFKGGNYMNFPVGISAEEFMADDSRVAQIGNNNIYNYYTPDFIAYILYCSVKTLPNGTNETYYFEMGDYFNYYRVAEGGGVGELINKDDSTKVINSIKSYYGIKVTVLADGVRQSSDSMFETVHGSSNFSLDGSNASGEYFMGKEVINCSLDCFDIVRIFDNYVGLKLKDSFIDSYSDVSNKIYLSIKIDVDELKSAGYEFVGFTKDSGLDNFDIFSVRTVQMINGELIEQEVAYA